jgi:hypothetical protein
MSSRWLAWSGLAHWPPLNRIRLEPSQRPDPKTPIETKELRKIKSVTVPTVPTAALSKTNGELRKNAAAIQPRRIPAPNSRMRIVVGRAIVRKCSRASKEIVRCGVIHQFATSNEQLAGTIPNFALVAKVIVETRVLASETLDRICVRNNAATAISLDHKCKVPVPIIEAIKAAPACRDLGSILRTTTRAPA